jgi:hypothetical protein
VKSSVMLIPGDDVRGKMEWIRISPHCAFNFQGGIEKCPSGSSCERDLQNSRYHPPPLHGNVAVHRFVQGSEMTCPPGQNVMYVI